MKLHFNGHFASYSTFKTTPTTYYPTLRLIDIITRGLSPLTGLLALCLCYYGSVNSVWRRHTNINKSQKNAEIPLSLLGSSLCQKHIKRKMRQCNLLYISVVALTRKATAVWGRTTGNRLIELYEKLFRRKLAERLRDT
ncbi:hypothetical protein ABVT39_017897 [Epinephelus coioides]